MWMRNAEFPYENFIAVHNTIQNNTTPRQWYARRGRVKQEQYLQSVGTKKQSECWTNMSFTLRNLHCCNVCHCLGSQHIIAEQLREHWNCLPNHCAGPLCLSIPGKFERDLHLMDSCSSSSLFWHANGRLQISHFTSVAVMWERCLRSTIAIIDGWRNRSIFHLPVRTRCSSTFPKDQPHCVNMKGIWLRSFSFPSLFRKRNEIYTFYTKKNITLTTGEMRIWKVYFLRSSQRH